jgi:hypothetical protein
MKPVLTIVVLLTVSVALNAQTFSAGFRTGASHWMIRKDADVLTRSAEGQSNTWDKELFIRATTKKRFAFEVSLGHYAVNDTRLLMPFECVWEGNYEPATGMAEERTQNLELNVTAQYDITYNAVQSRSVLRRLKSYIGLTLTPTYSFTKTELTYTSLVSGAVTSYNGTARKLELWTGLNHTLVYNLSDAVYLTSVVSYKVEPWSFFSSTYWLEKTNNRLGLQLGLGCNL